MAEPTCLRHLLEQLHDIAAAILAYPGWQHRYPQECRELAYWQGCLRVRLDEPDTDPDELRCDYAALSQQVSLLAPHGRGWGWRLDGTLGLTSMALN